MRTLSIALALGLLPTAALADNISPQCQGIPKPDDYNDVIQQDFLANYYALALTLSPLHSPIPNEPGHGSLGVDLLVMPPVSCAHQFVLGHTKTEDTNVTPVAPRLRATFTFPAIGPVHIYAGAGYAPPVTVFGTRNVIAGGEIGAGIAPVDLFQAGVRYHYQLSKTIGEIATPFTPEGEVFLDFYQASTMGFDAMAGLPLSPLLRPYLSAGILDASTFFWVGDDGIVTNNVHPYLGPAFSLGADGLVAKHVRYAFEMYAAPGGHSLARDMPGDDPAADFATFSNTGHLYTVRLRIAAEL